MEGNVDAPIVKAMAFGPAKYGETLYPVTGFTKTGQPIVHIPGIGPRFGRMG
jgi:hypothetical protein